MLSLLLRTCGEGRQKKLQLGIFSSHEEHWTNTCSVFAASRSKRKQNQCHICLFTSFARAWRSSVSDHCEHHTRQSECLDLVAFPLCSECAVCSCLLGVCRGPLLSPLHHTSETSRKRRGVGGPRGCRGVTQQLCEVVALTGTSRLCVCTLAGRATTVQPVYRVAP